MLSFLKKVIPSLGQKGEQMAQKEYQRKGYKIISENEFNRFGKQLGEIDFIAQKNNSLVFVEVKTRSTNLDTYGGPFEAVGKSKQSKLLKATKLFLLKHPEFEKFNIQIDVCLIIMSDLDKTPRNVIILSNAVEDNF